MRKNEVLSFDRFVSIMAVVLNFETYFMYVVAKCLHFVMSYMNQNKKHKQTLESAQYELEISFKLLCLLLILNSISLGLI